MKTWVRWERTKRAKQGGAASLLVGCLVLWTACGGTSQLRAGHDEDEGVGGAQSSDGAGGSQGGTDSVGGSGVVGGSGGGFSTGGMGGDFGFGGVGGSFAGGGSSGDGGTEAVAGSGGTGGDYHGESIFVLDGFADLEDDDFFDHPWPSDYRLDGSESVVLSGYPNPAHIDLIETYQTVMAGRLKGFSPAAAGYLRFTVALDPSTLPASVPASVSDSSSVQLIDVSPASPDYGKHMMIAVQFYAAGNEYVPENTLAFAPALGQPLRPKTRYALVVTDSVLDTHGEWLDISPELSKLVDDGGATGSYAEAIDELDALGVDDILHLAVFTTSDPTREAYALRDTTVTSFESPQASDYSAQEQVSGLYDVYEGIYGPSPDFQAGTPPFLTPTAGGDVRYDANGNPIVQREVELRFALGVPDATNCPPPATGYPIVLVAHGTGGDYRTAFEGDNAEVRTFASVCLATLSIDQIFHGTRPGGDLGIPDLLYFNLQNPLAARSNGPQSATDFVQLARLVVDNGLVVPSDVSRTGVALEFDPDRVLFFGHSQGGLNGPILLAADDQTRGGVMSGAAATISVALLEKKEPYDFPALLAQLLGIADPSELDAFHPALSLAQLLADPSDGIHYARTIVNEPRAAFVAKSLFMTAGVRADGTGDSYAPPLGIEALAAAVGLPGRLPEIHPSILAQWRGLAPLMVPSAGLSGNLALGTASGALAQYDADAASDGHFVAYQVPEARTDVAAFLRSLADDAAGRVPQ